MPRVVSMDLYDRFKDDVWRLTNHIQRYKDGKALRGLTDKEIAQRLGLTLEDAIEIRSIAENEKIPLEAYLDADRIKEKRFKRVPTKKG